MNKYLLCVGKNGSHDGALKYLTKMLENKRDVGVEIFISIKEDLDGSSMFSDNEKPSDVKMIIENIRSTLSISGVVNITECCVQDSLHKGLNEKILNDKEIIGIIFGISSSSPNKHGTIANLITNLDCSVTAIPILIIPNNITDDQVIRSL